MSEQELREKVTAIVLQILQRGRLNQLEIEGRLLVRDMGVDCRKDQFVDGLLTLMQSATTEAINLEHVDRYEHLTPYQKRVLIQHHQSALQSLQNNKEKE